MEPESGTVVLLGAGALDDPSTSQQLAELASGPVVVLPTAAAFTGMETAVVEVTGRFVELGLEVEGVMAASRADAQNEELVKRLDTAALVWLADGNSLHLKTTLRDTLLLDALWGVLARGGVVAASGSVASALCDPMIDPRGGAPMIGLGLVTSVCVVAGDEAASGHDEMRNRTLGLVSPTMPVAVLAPGTGLTLSSQGPSSIGGMPDVYVGGRPVADGLSAIGSF